MKLDKLTYRELSDLLKEKDKEKAMIIEAMKLIESSIPTFNHRCMHGNYTNAEFSIMVDKLKYK